MKFSGKMCLKVVLKVIKNQGSTPSIEDTFSKKPQGGDQIESPTPPFPTPHRHIRVKYDLHLRHLCIRRKFLE